MDDSHHYIFVADRPLMFMDKTKKVTYCMDGFSGCAVLSEINFVVIFPLHQLSFSHFCIRFIAGILLQSLTLSNKKQLFNLD